jgi:hypothetical protein
VPSGPANAAGLNNAGNDPSGAGNSSKTPNAPGTNAAGTANASGSPGNGRTVNGGHGAIGTVGNAGTGGGGRIDGTTTSGPRMQGDDVIRQEDAVDSKVDKKIKSICKGC